MGAFYEKNGDYQPTWDPWNLLPGTCFVCAWLGFANQGLYIHIYRYIDIDIWPVSWCQNSVSSLGSRKLGIAFGGALSLSMVFAKRGKEEDRKRKRKGKRKGKRKRERKMIGKRKRRRRGKEMKRKRKGMEKEKKRKGRGKRGKRKGVKAEEGEKRKEKKRIYFWPALGLFFDKWVSLRYR